MLFKLSGRHTSIISILYQKDTLQNRQDRIEQKGIVFFTTTLVIHSPFLLPSPFYQEGREKGERITRVVVKKTMTFCSITQDRFPLFFVKKSGHALIKVHLSYFLYQMSEVLVQKLKFVLYSLSPKKCSHSTKNVYSAKFHPQQHTNF